MHRRRGFTLVEMLLVVAIITLLIALLLPSLHRAKGITRRVVCATNQGAVMKGIVVQSQDNPKREYLPTSAYTNDDISIIVPAYTSRDMSICPNTQHRAENLAASYGSPAPSQYHSYEMFSWIGKAGYPTGEKFNKFIKLSRYNAKRPSEIWIAMDDSSLHGNNNWPDAGNNHGAEGLNLGYLDGHGGWHDRAQYVRAALTSYHPWFGNHSTALSLAQSAVPNVQSSGTGWEADWWYD